MHQPLVSISPGSVRTLFGWVLKGNQRDTTDFAGSNLKKDEQRRARVLLSAVAEATAVWLGLLPTSGVVEKRSFSRADYVFPGVGLGLGLKIGDAMGDASSSGRSRPFFFLFFFFFFCLPEPVRLLLFFWGGDLAGLWCFKLPCVLFCFGGFFLWFGKGTIRRHTLAEVPGEAASKPATSWEASLRGSARRRVSLMDICWNQHGCGSKNQTKLENPGKWKHGPKPAVCPSCLILSHTHIALRQ